MNYLKEIWYFLQNEKEELKYQCDECTSYDCKKFIYNDILKKRYAEFNIIDHKQCLKEKKEELERLDKLRRKPMFNKFSYEPCTLCKKKFFKDDMHSAMEMEKQNKEKTKKAFRGKFVYACNKCKPKYKRMKKAYYGDEFGKGSI